jgi:uncharacterized protein (TIGR02145 family)
MKQFICLSLPVRIQVQPIQVLVMLQSYRSYRLLIVVFCVSWLSSCDEDVVPIQADFTANVTTMVAGNTVQFTDNSSGEVTSWSWTFQGGLPATSNEQTPPAVLYRGAGSFNVSLTVTGPQGTDTKTTEAMITVTPPPCEGGLTTVTYHGRDYRVVGIGSACWFEENLATTLYRNGTEILHITDSAEWFNNTANATPAYCFFDNNSSLGDGQGALYNWYAVDNPLGICPDGWHVATDQDFKNMKMHLGLEQQYVDLSEHGEDIKLGPMLKSFFGWNASSTGGHNSSGFNGMPWGRRGASASFGSFGRDGYWWTSTAFSATKGWSHSLRGGAPHSAHRGSEEKRAGYACRCVKD